MSLPSRERGLKFVWPKSDGNGAESLPSRERGLKLLFAFRTVQSRTSLPSRERVLKCSQSAHLADCHAVAPFAGAWIEITAMAAIQKSQTGRSLRGSVD